MLQPTKYLVESRETEQGHCVMAGWLKRDTLGPRNAPDRVDGWSVVLNQVEEAEGVVHGNMDFPETCTFEYQGTLEKFVRALRRAQGGRATFGIAGLTCWRT